MGSYDHLDDRNAEEAFEKLKTLLETAEGDLDIATLDAAVQALSTASHKLAEIIYQQAQQDAEAQTYGAPGSTGPDAAQADGEESVVDADFEVVDDDSEKQTSESEKKE